MPKRYRKLRGDTAYYPFAARTGLRARQRRHVRVLRGAGLAALALVLARMKRRDWARHIAGGLCVAAAVLFVLYYPALSGLPIPAWWADALEVLPSFGFY